LNPTWNGSKPTSRNSADESPGRNAVALRLSAPVREILSWPTAKLQGLLTLIRVELLSRQSGRTRSIDH